MDDRLIFMVEATPDGDGSHSINLDIEGDFRKLMQMLFVTAVQNDNVSFIVKKVAEALQNPDMIEEALEAIMLQS